jgi:cholesterol transport system auxiliary component
MSLDAGSGAQPAVSSTRRAAARRFARHAALALAIGLALSGCSVIDKPVRPAVYDFGPGPLATLAAAPAGQAAITLAEVESGAALDSTAVLYRLTYTNAQQLLPYAQARWSMAPAQLLRQRLRERIGQQRTVLGPDDANLGADQTRLVLRVELEEFSQLFSAPATSTGLVRLRATLVQSAAGGDRLVGQRMVVAQRPAASADAPGGVRALTEATDAAVDELAQWLSQQR